MFFDPWYKSIKSSGYYLEIIILPREYGCNRIIAIAALAIIVVLVTTNRSGHAASAGSSELLYSEYHIDVSNFRNEFPVKATASDLRPGTPEKRTISSRNSPQIPEITLLRRVGKFWTCSVRQ